MEADFMNYARQIVLPEIGEQGQERLSKAKVLVIGAGGLGCPTLQYLAAAGVGKLGVVDHDRVTVTNLHRQILFGPQDIQRLKVEVVKEKLNFLYPTIDIVTYPLFIDNENAIDLIRQYDMVIDGCDNFATRYVVNDSCVKANKPLISGSINQYEAQISIFNYGGSADYRTLYPNNKERANCDLGGVLGPFCGIVGSYLANETLKLILKYHIDNLLVGKLLSINIKKNTFTIYKYSQANIQHTNIAAAQDSTLINWSAAQELIYNKNNIILVDVRERWEFEELNLGGVNMPLSEINQNIDFFTLQNTYIFICQQGNKSQIAVRLLKSINDQLNIFNVTGGVSELSI